MEYTIGLAAFDYLPNIAFLVGAYFLVRISLLIRGRPCGRMMMAGTLLVFAGGFFKATWKMLYTTGVADLHLMVGRLIEPAGSNASEAYQAVLELHPGNERANKGLEQICDRILDSARAKSTLHDYAGARKEIDAGLLLIPRHGGLLELRRQLEHESETINRSD